MGGASHQASAAVPPPHSDLVSITAAEGVIIRSAVGPGDSGTPLTCAIFPLIFRGWGGITGRFTAHLCVLQLLSCLLMQLKFDFDVTRSVYTEKSSQDYPEHPEGDCHCASLTHHMTGPVI